jgi:hypothetical protein
VFVLEKIEFCQCHPVMDNNGKYIMVRDPRKAISKDAVALKPLDNYKVARQWMAAIGEGGLSLTLSLPIYQEYYDMYRRNSCGSKPLNSKEPTFRTDGMFRMSVGMKRTPTPISDNTRFSFWLAFGLTPEMQIAMEHYYKSLTFGDDSSCRFTSLPL